MLNCYFHTTTFNKGTSYEHWPNSNSGHKHDLPHPSTAIADRHVAGFHSFPSCSRCCVSLSAMGFSGKPSRHISIGSGSPPDRDRSRCRRSAWLSRAVRIGGNRWIRSPLEKDLRGNSRGIPNARTRRISDLIHSPLGLDTCGRTSEGQSCDVRGIVWSF